MRIGLAQINTTVGDLPGNRDRIRAAYDQLVAAGAELVLTPELALSGYPPRDLLFRAGFLEDCRDALEALVATTGEVPLLVGLPVPNEGAGRPVRNAAAWCEGGRVRHLLAKSLLPTYDVFDEDRYFEPAPAPAEPISCRGQRIAVTICEDLWYGQADHRYARQADPLEALRSSAPDLVLNLSASPWHFGKQEVRGEVLRRTAATLGVPVVYANSIGGNDELIFDGRSLCAGRDGTVHEVGPAFAEGTPLVDTEDPAASALPPPERLAEVHGALVLGIRDYLGKTGFPRALVGLSGGIDSAVTMALAVDALGADRVRGVALPSSISSAHSVRDAAALAANLGIRYDEIPIAGLVGAAEDALAGLFAGTEPGIAEENIQSRARGLLLMALSNKFGDLLLTTGNKSELAVGYCTLYGDMAGGLAVLSDVPKTLVYELARYLNRDGERIPVATIEKEPSAELRPDQRDVDSLPPYPVLDRILELAIEERRSREAIVAEGFPSETVRDILAKVDRNEYKRQQAAPGLKITPLAFGIGRRIPIVQKYQP